MTADAAEKLSLAAQLGSILVALIAGRFVVTSRAAVWGVALAGAVGAMVAHIMVDGQGAFLLLIYAPLIYFMAVIGRRDLDRRLPRGRGRMR